MSYYQSQLRQVEVQRFIIGEFNKALSQFPNCTLIPSRLSVWGDYSTRQMNQLIKYRNHYYLIGLHTGIYKCYKLKEKGQVEVCYKQIRECQEVCVN